MTNAMTDMMMVTTVDVLKIKLCKQVDDLITESKKLLEEIV